MGDGKEMSGAGKNMVRFRELHGQGAVQAAVDMHHIGGYLPVFPVNDLVDGPFQQHRIRCDAHVAEHLLF